MKYFLLALTGTLLLFSGFSQETSRFNTTTYNASVDSLAEALVAFAMNNPAIHSAENAAGFYQQTYKASKTAWLNNIIAQGNLNELSLKQSSSNDPLKPSTVYPRYNFGVTVPLGIFINNPKQTKADYYKYKSTVDQIEVTKQDIRLQVLTAYQDYMLQLNLRRLEDEVVHDYEIIYIKDKDAFAKGQITLETFNYASMMYHNELTKQATIEATVKVDEAKIEALIGMRFSEALEQIRAHKQQ